MDIFSWPSETWGKKVNEINSIIRPQGWEFPPKKPLRN